MRFRLIEKRDYDTCRSLLHPALGLSARVLDNIVDIWDELSAAGTFAVIEDPARRHPDSIQGFGSTAFVSDAFVDAFVESGRSHLDAEVYDAIVDGRSPVLSAAEIARANGGRGVSVAVFSFGLRNHDIADTHTQRVLQLGSAAFFFTHGGYRLNVLLNEVFGEAGARYMEAGGFRRLRSGARPSGAEDHQPILFMLRRDWVEAGAVHPLSFLFHTEPPLIGFSSAEQRVLTHALLNRPDPEIAACLGLTLDAVKKTWRRIYERVSRRVPYLIHGNERAAGAEHRTLEKRRHLLEYLRTHLEEVRPWSAPKGAKAATTLNRVRHVAG
jgi:hypothetical protein